MKKQIYIQVPEPCHEDWSKMTRVEQGRFCESCAKEVVDFSVMSDQEIISFLSKPRGKTCGNFSNDQLNRAINEPTPPAKKRGWAIVLSFLITLAGACKLRSDVRGIIDTTTGDMIATVAQPTEKAAHVDSPVVKQESVIYEELLKGEMMTTVGIIDIAQPVWDCVIPPEPANDVDTIPIIESDTLYGIGQIPEVTVIGYKTTRRSAYLGTASVLTREKPSLADNVKDTIANLFNPSRLRLYPNPASKSGFVNVQVFAEGNYQLLLLDNASRSILQKRFSITGKHQAYQLELPSTISAGIYYVSVIDEASKKQVTKKLIVE